MTEEVAKNRLYSIVCDTWDGEQFSNPEIMTPDLNISNIEDGYKVLSVWRNDFINHGWQINKAFLNIFVVTLKQGKDDLVKRFRVEEKTPVIEDKMEYGPTEEKTPSLSDRSEYAYVILSDDWDHVKKEWSRPEVQDVAWTLEKAKRCIREWADTLIVKSNNESIEVSDYGFIFKTIGYTRRYFIIGGYPNE